MKIEHAAVYLPYGLKMIMDTSKWFEPEGDILVYLRGILDFGDYISYQYDRPHERTTGNFQTDRFKPILRPLSDLRKEITHNGKTFVPINHLKHKYGWEYMWSYATKPQGSFNINAVAYACVKNLLSWHFDIFGLIESGEAIDVNTLEKNPYE